MVGITMYCTRLPIVVAWQQCFKVEWDINKPTRRLLSAWRCVSACGQCIQHTMHMVRANLNISGPWLEGKSDSSTIHPYFSRKCSSYKYLTKIPSRDDESMNHLDVRQWSSSHPVMSTVNVGHKCVDNDLLDNDFYTNRSVDYSR